MNICILSHRYPYKDNMVHVFVKKLVDEWAKMGHRCVVISPLSIVHAKLGKEFIAPTYEKQQVGESCFVEVYRPQYVAIPRITLGGVSLNSYAAQCCIEKTINSLDITFDAIYCHFYSMAFVGWHYAHINSIPLFVATGESTFSSFVKPCRSFSLNKFRDTLSGVVAVSTKNKNEAIQLGYATEKDTMVFPNGANLGVFTKKSKHDCRRLLNIPLDDFVIICVGQIIERKGQKRILEAINKIDGADIKTIFIGKGEEILNHKSIIFQGSVKNIDLPTYLNAADLFVLPTLHEGCCNAIIEALACGLPIVSSNREFNFDVLDANNSILVDPCNIDEIADAIERIYHDIELRNCLAENSYTTGQKLGIIERAACIIEFMQQKIAQVNE